MLVKILQEVPDETFNPALNEISVIPWNKISDPTRSGSSTFSTSTSIHIRRHKISNIPMPTSLREWCMICDCEDTPEYLGQYFSVRGLANWIFNTVSGKEMGRIMIVNLAPRGSVGLHIDPYDYFDMYSRFHVAIKTNSGVVFSGGAGTPHEHMPYKFLCQLNNKMPHQLENNSDENRIHVIVDIAIPGGNQIF